MVEFIGFGVAIMCVVEKGIQAGNGKSWKNGGHCAALCISNGITNAQDIYEPDIRCQAHVKRGSLPPPPRSVMFFKASLTVLTETWGTTSLRNPDSVGLFAFLYSLIRRCF